MLSGFIAHHHRTLPCEQSHSLWKIVAVSVVHSVSHHGCLWRSTGSELMSISRKKTFIVQEFSCLFLFLLSFDLVPGHSEVQLYAQTCLFIRTPSCPILQSPALALPGRSSAVSAQLTAHLLRIPKEFPIINIWTSQYKWSWCCFFLLLLK